MLSNIMNHTSNLTVAEINKAIEQLHEQINFNLQHKNFALVVALNTGLIALTNLKLSK